jgi:hypothetical protein
MLYPEYAWQCQDFPYTTKAPPPGGEGRAVCFFPYVSTTAAAMQHQAHNPYPRLPRSSAGFL